MKIVDIDNTQGDLKLLALAVQALIDTHPNKKAFQQKFWDMLNAPEKFSLYHSEKKGDPTGQLLVDLKRTSHSSSDVGSNQAE